MALTWIPFSKKQPKLGKNITIKWSDGTEDDGIWGGVNHYESIVPVEWADPDYITWKGLFICMWYAMPVLFFSLFAKAVTKSKFLLRIQYPIHLWIEMKFQHANWGLSKKLEETK